MYNFNIYLKSRNIKTLLLYKIKIYFQFLNLGFLFIDKFQDMI